MQADACDRLGCVWLAGTLLPRALGGLWHARGRGATCVRAARGVHAIVRDAAGEAHSPLTSQPSCGSSRYTTAESGVTPRGEVCRACEGAGTLLKPRSMRLILPTAQPAVRLPAMLSPVAAPPRVGPLTALHHHPESPLAPRARVAVAACFRGRVCSWSTTHWTTTRLRLRTSLLVNSSMCARAASTHLAPWSPVPRGCASWAGRAPAARCREHLLRLLLRSRSVGAGTCDFGGRVDHKSDVPAALAMPRCHRSRG